MSPTSTSRARSKSLRSIGLLRPENRDLRNLGTVKSYLGSMFPAVKVQLRPPLADGLDEEARDSLASSLASARVKDPTASRQKFEPMYGEIDYERRVLEGEARAGGLVYDGRVLEELLSSLIKPSLENALVVITDRLVSTFSEDDRRHHLRTIVFGFPSILSVPGIVEAPARPREYYLLRQELEIQGAGLLRLEKLKKEFKGRFMDYGDTRTIEVVKGLTLQAVLFHLTLDPFCPNRNCRLFNAHWQEDLIRSQVDSGSLCHRHTKMVERLGARPEIEW